VAQIRPIIIYLFFEKKNKGVRKLIRKLGAKTGTLFSAEFLLKIDLKIVSCNLIELEKSKKKVPEIQK